MCRYAKHLRSKYQETLIPVTASNSLTYVSDFLGLAVVQKHVCMKVNSLTRFTLRGDTDDIVRMKEEIPLRNLFRGTAGKKTILVIGAPGMGKTTLLHEICRMWRRGEAGVGRFRLCILLTLRLSQIQRAQNLYHLLFHDDQLEFTEEDFTQFIKELDAGRDVLLLLDGYDELPMDLRNDESIFGQLIYRELLPNANIVITSRPWAISEVQTRFLHDDSMQMIEVIGFTEQKIERYVNTAFGPGNLERAQTFLQSLKLQPITYRNMRVPFNLVVLVQSYLKNTPATAADHSFIPTTQTDLYTQILLTTVQQNLKEKCVKQICNFDDVPQSEKTSLLELCKLAYDGIDEDKLVFEVKDCNHPANHFGLLQAVEDDSSLVCSFVHKTIQEYLAAYHITQLPPEELIKCWHQHAEDDDFVIVLRFLAGLTRHITTEIEGNCEPLLKVVYRSLQLNSVIEYEHPNITFEFNLEHAHWLFECGNTEIICHVLTSPFTDVVQVDRALWNEWFPVQPLGMFFLGYTIAHSNSFWEVWLPKSHIGDEGLRMLCKGMESSTAECNPCITLLNLHQNDIFGDGLDHLLHFTESVLSNLGQLVLSGNALSDTACHGLARLVSKVKHSLSELDLAATNITDADFAVVCEALMPIEESRLTMLDLTLNEGIGDTTVNALVDFLQKNMTLRALWLYGTSVSGESARKILSVLADSNTTLIELSLPTECQEYVEASKGYENLKERILILFSETD